MKKILFALLLTAGSIFGSYAQDKVNQKDVPAAVQTSFKNEFSNAKDVEWKRKDGKYKVEFEINGLDNIAAFEAGGKLIAKGMKIRRSELPTPVANAVKASYADKTIDAVYRMDKNGSAYYLVKLSGNPETKVLYSPGGQVANENMD